MPKGVSVVAARVSLGVFYVFWTLLLVGFFFHRSAEPVVLNYGRNYLVVLALLLLIYLAPLCLVVLIRVADDRKPLFALATFAAFVGVLYVGAALRYYYSRTYPFDIWLQLQPQPLAEQYAEAKDEGVIRILAMGGSTTQSVIGIRDPEQRYPRRVERTLRERFPDQRIEVLNAGMAWYTTQHSLVNYVTCARRWQPDIVVVMHAVNDLTRSFEPPGLSLGHFNDRWSHHYGPAARAADPPSFEGLWLRFLAQRWFSTVRVREQDFGLEKFRSVEGFQDYLGSLARYVAADGAELVLVTQPSLLKEAMSDEEKAMLRVSRSHLLERHNYWDQRYASPHSFLQAMQLFNESTRRVARAEGLVLIDAAQQVPPEIEYFLDDVHYTPRGAELLAAAVAERLTVLIESR